MPTFVSEVSGTDSVSRYTPAPAVAYGWSRAIANGVCTSPLNMKVRSAGASSVAFVRSSFVSAYSNSRPTISSPAPTANPLTGRLVGVPLTPRNAVMSADATDGVSSTIRRAESRPRTRNRMRMHHGTTRLPRWTSDLGPRTSDLGSRTSNLEPRVIISSAMDFRPTEEQALLRRTVREFAESEIGPHVMEWDEAQHFPMELLPKLAALGLM